MPPKKEKNVANNEPVVPESNVVIGIDFGAHYACVGVMKNDRVEICPNQQGNRTTPSVVAFVGDDRLVGDEAKQQIDRNPANTIYDIKNILGLKYSDPELQKEMKKFPFKITEQDDKVLLEVMYKGKQQYVTPVEITSFILQQIKQTADNFVGANVKRAVITVPNDFSEEQRRLLKEAASNVGLNVVRFVHEHAAVACAYGYDSVSKNISTRKNERVLVFDLGGRGLTISVLSAFANTIEFLGSHSEHSLSGEAFDAALVAHFSAEFKRKYRGLDLSESARSIAKLKSASEKAKRTLSNLNQASIELDSLFDGRDFFTSITRAKFEDLSFDIIKACRAALEAALVESKTTKEQIDRIILVGGGSRIPAIQNFVSSFFGGKELEKSIAQEEVVCFGATLQAAILEHGGSSYTDKKSLNGAALPINVVPTTIGIANASGQMVPILGALGRVPARRTFKIVNEEDNQKNIHLSVYQGNEPLVADNKLISRFIFDMEPKPKGESHLEIKFEMDSNGVLTITSGSKTYSVKPEQAQ
eukprot:gene12225-14315_t